MATHCAPRYCWWLQAQSASSMESCHAVVTITLVHFVAHEDPHLRIRFQVEMASFFDGVELVNAKGETARAESVLTDKVVALFFSADWCPYCHDFLPALQTFYEEANEGAGKRLEIVFVSSDTDNDAFFKYFAVNHGPWWAIPHTNETLRQDVKRKYEVAGRKELEGLGLADRKGGLPTLLVVNAEGVAVDYDGVEKVNKLGLVALEKWEAQLTQP